MATVKFYRFTITDRAFPASVSSIPFDMFRYDACFPATQEDASNLSLLSSSHLTPADKLNLKSFTLSSYRKPTIARWESFGWTVSNITTFPS